MHNHDIMTDIWLVALSPYRLIIMSSNSAVDHITVPLQQLPFEQQVQRICTHVHLRSLANSGDIAKNAWTDAVGSVDDLTKAFMRAHSTLASLHDYFTACTNRGVAVDGVAAINIDDQLRDEHRVFSSWLQRHQSTTCAQWRLGARGKS